MMVADILPKMPKKLTWWKRIAEDDEGWDRNPILAQWKVAEK